MEIHTVYFAKHNGATSETTLAWSTPMYLTQDEIESTRTALQAHQPPMIEIIVLKQEK